MKIGTWPWGNDRKRVTRRKTIPATVSYSWEYDEYLDVYFQETNHLLNQADGRTDDLLISWFLGLGHESSSFRKKKLEKALDL